MIYDNLIDNKVIGESSIAAVVQQQQLLLLLLLQLQRLYAVALLFDVLLEYIYEQTNM